MFALVELGKSALGLMNEDPLVAPVVWSVAEGVGCEGHRYVKADS